MSAAILEFRPAAAPGIVPPKTGEADLLRLFALDRLAGVPRRLVCRWHRDAEGRLCCAWEPDIGIPLPR